VKAFQQRKARTGYKHVPEIYQVNGCHIIMQKIKERTLRNYILAGGYVDRDRIIEIGTAALQSIHSAGIRYGDNNLEIIC
jgi:tRNA A-37 threonylcarbamoyl transferase component Bud32